jgi:hypothetical protein
MHALRLHLVLSLVLLLGVSGCSRKPQGFSRVVLQQLERYPHMQIQDLYKLAFQEALGNEHLMSDTSEARNYLLEELRSVPPDSAEVLLEEIDPEGSLVRVNLRPFKAAGFDPEVLVEAMFRTSATIKPSEKRLEANLRSIQDLVADGRIPFELRELLPYIEQQRVSGYPAVHHSAEYMQAYHPAYRVVLRAFLPFAPTR